MDTTCNSAWMQLCSNAIPNIYVFLVFMPIIHTDSRNIWTIFIRDFLAAVVDYYVAITYFIVIIATGINHSSSYG